MAADDPDIIWMPVAEHDYVYDYFGDVIAVIVVVIVVVVLSSSCLRRVFVLSSSCPHLILSLSSSRLVFVSSCLCVVLSSSRLRLGTTVNYEIRD